MQAVVIGAGIGGLGAALRLRAAGMDVLVLERRPILGGKMHHVCNLKVLEDFLNL